MVASLEKKGEQMDKKTGKKTGLIIGLIAVVILCAGVGYFMFDDKNSGKVAEMLATIPGTAKAEKISTNIASKSVVLSNFSYENPEKTVQMTVKKVTIGGIDLNTIFLAGTPQFVKEIIAEDYTIVQKRAGATSETTVHWDELVVSDATVDFKALLEMVGQRGLTDFTAEMLESDSPLSVLPEEYLKILKENMSSFDNFHLGSTDCKGFTMTVKDDDTSMVCTIGTVLSKDVTTVSVSDFSLRDLSCTAEKDGVAGVGVVIQAVDAQKLLIPSIPRFLVEEDLKNSALLNIFTYGVVDISDLEIKNIELSVANKTQEKEISEVRNIQKIKINLLADGKKFEKDVLIDGIEVTVNDIKMLGIFPYYEEMYGKPLHFSFKSKGKADRINDDLWKVQMQDMGISEPELGSISLVADYDVLPNAEIYSEKIAVYNATSILVDKNFFGLGIQLNAAQMSGAISGPDFDAARIQLREYLNSPQICAGLEASTAEVCHNFRQFALYPGTFTLELALDEPVGLENLVMSTGWKSSYVPDLKDGGAVVTEESAPAEKTEQP